MSRFLSFFAVAALTLLGASCSQKLKPTSAFARGAFPPPVFDDVAAQTGATKSLFGFARAHDDVAGKASWKGNVYYCARPDQIDEVMRVMYAEFVKKVRESGAEPRGDAPPAAPAAVKEWTLAYTTGSQEGALRVTRNDGREGQCRNGLTEYVVEYVLEEAPKAP